MSMFNDISWGSKDNKECDSKCSALNFVHSRHWSDQKVEEHHGRRRTRKYTRYCPDSSGIICTSEVFKVIQDAVSLI